MPDIYTTDLLNVIAKGESRGNYNAYFGNANNNKIRFTEMTVGEVLEWQRSFVAGGNASSAVGRYQFIDGTLQGLIDQLRVNTDTLFDEALQDRLANALLERRGLREYVNDKISRDEFAHNISKEWAAVPRVIGDNPDASYYDGDGINSAQLSQAEILDAIASVRTL